MSGGASGLARRVARRLACAVGAHHVGRRLNRRRLLVVCYHGVAARGEERHGSWLLLPAEALEAQLRYLAAHYRVVPIDRALDELAAGAIDRPTACVTFDDGYRNNLTVALPLLERHRAPATVYLATGLVGTERRLWTTALELAFTHATAATIDLSAAGLESAVPLGDEAARVETARRVCAALKSWRPTARDAELARLHAALGVPRDRAASADGDGAFAIMSWDEVRAAAKSGVVTFGGHTVNHEIVSRLDDAAVDAEVGGSMRAVAERVPEAATRTFAYPNGQPADFDERAAAAVRAAGGTAALSTIEGLNDAATDRFALRRIVVGGDMALDDFRLATAGVYAALKALLRRRRAPALAAVTR